jgi:hypothetical protein
MSRSSRLSPACTLRVHVPAVAMPATLTLAAASLVSSTRRAQWRLATTSTALARPLATAVVPSKAEGDICPGMDIFDSATPEMRRKCNQKKATSVIVQLQARGEIVTPTELIFDNLGQFKKERIISGEPNSEPATLAPVKSSARWCR